MSVEQVKKAAAEHSEPYVALPVAVFAAAFQEAGVKPEKGSFAEHVAARMRINPDALMHAHREAHLAPLLGRKDPAAKSPSASKLEA